VKIGIYGGTFNPPHLGHMAAAREVQAALGLDKVLLIPDNTPPHKELPSGSPTPQQRLEMTQLMADRLGKHFEACPIELERQGRSYTADTLRELAQRYPGDELYFLMGTDMFLTLEHWYQPETICRYAHIVAFGRNAGDTDTFQTQKKRLKKRFDAKVKIITLEGLVEVSSTVLRQQLAHGGGRELLEESVYGYILLNHLYGTEVDLHDLSLPDLRACSYAMTRAKRLPHIRGIEAEAALLAAKNGVDAQTARRAAILHDCTKYWSEEKQLSFCEKYGILVDQIERENPGLLHAKTGAEVARQRFGMSEEICQAIRWHTTGKAGMTTLEKIIYIADYAEPSRPYDWCKQLRVVVEQDLDRGVLMGLENTITQNQSKQKAIHPDGVEALAWMRQALAAKEHGR
jgi:nicotinate-nucleotide adenylyltransferase